jgi:hypothetical protein
MSAAVIDHEPADRVLHAPVIGFSPEGLYFAAQLRRLTVA